MRSHESDPVTNAAFFISESHELQVENIELRNDPFSRVFDLSNCKEA